MLRAAAKRRRSDADAQGDEPMPDAPGWCFVCGGNACGAWQIRETSVQAGRYVHMTLVAEKRTLPLTPRSAGGHAQRQVAEHRGFHHLARAQPDEAILQ